MMTSTDNASDSSAGWELLPHDADVRLLGRGPTPDVAFEQAALALHVVVTRAFSSACDSAGRAMSRHAALRQHSGRQIDDDLAERGILIRSPSTRGVAEEAPDAYKDVSKVILAAENAGIARRVARMRPMICIKG